MHPNLDFRPLIVGIGGTTRPDSTSERAVRVALAHAEALGAKTMMFGGPELMLPIYDPAQAEREESARRLITALRDAHGIVLASPGYHGSISGMIKNALDYTEDMRSDPRSYFAARAVGCIGCAAGWQAANSTLTTIRSIVHALRGWPTPFGVTINSTEPIFDAAGNCIDEKTLAGLKLIAKQVIIFASMRFIARSALPDWEIWGASTGEIFPEMKIVSAAQAPT
jgi:FMN reductase